MNVTLTPSKPEAITKWDVLLNGANIGEVEVLPEHAQYGAGQMRALLHIQYGQDYQVATAIGRGDTQEEAIIAALDNCERDSKRALSEIERLRGLL